MQFLNNDIIYYSFVINLKKRYPDLPGPMWKSNVEEVVITFWAKSH